MTHAFLLLGANLGDRQATLLRATSLLGQRAGTVRTTSHFYETAPWGNLDQPAFLNQALKLLTPLTPLDLLATMQSIEEELGRIRRDKWGARLIDLDILFYGQEIIEMPSLIVPHPHLAQRRFALAPLAEIAATFVHPALGKTVAELLEICPDLLEVKRL